MLRKIILLLTVFTVGSCATVKQAFEPKISPINVNGQVIIFLVPYTEQLDSSEKIKEYFFRRHFERKTAYAWGKRSSDYAYNRYSEILASDNGDFIFRNGLYIKTTSRGTRLGHSFNEFLTSINCLDQVTYTSCTLIFESGKRVDDHHYAEDFLPQTSPHQLVKNIYGRSTKAFIVKNNIESKHDVDVLQGELEKQGIKAYLDKESGLLSYGMLTVSANINALKIKQGYLLSVERKILPVTSSINTLDYVKPMIKFNQHLESLVE